MIEKIKGEL
jgi:predicted RNase H-like nuclease (RuvC/YqgF family)